MKVINTGSNYSFYGDEVKTYDTLPSIAYTVEFSEKSGFYLERFSDINVKEKIYGIHQEKVEKVFNTFTEFERSLGVILSGDKGIGKSLFGKMLSIKCVQEGYPLIIVNRYYQGIASFLDSIEQEVMVLFDEFDKTFGEVRAGDGFANPQTELLSLFDGISQGKKLFVISCNSLRNISDFLVNRPGRFHYHFRFEYPGDTEITEYFTDKLEEQYRGEIEKVISFSKKVPLNYDCLRAIAFELNKGDPFEEAIKDLNIVNMNDEEYKLKLCFENGRSFTKESHTMDLFDEAGSERTWLYDSQGKYIYVSFDICNVKWDANRGTFVEGKDIKISADEDEPETLKELQKEKILYLIITRKAGKSLHYTI